MIDPPPLRRSVKFLTATYDQFQEALAEIDTDKPRSCVVFAHALLEQITINALRSRMIELTEDEDKRLFRGTSPLATMSARIRLLYALNMIDKGTRKNLELISEIRNRIAHADVVVGFDDLKVSQKCLQLFEGTEFHEDAQPPRKRFIRSFKMLFIELSYLIQPDTPEPSPDKSAK